MLLPVNTVDPFQPALFSRMDTMTGSSPSRGSATTWRFRVNKAGFVNENCCASIVKEVVALVSV